VTTVKPDPEQKSCPRNCYEHRNTTGVRSNCSRIRSIIKHHHAPVGGGGNESMRSVFQVGDRKHLLLVQKVWCRTRRQMLVLSRVNTVNRECARG
jgi:hypothetical protein